MSKSKKPVIISKRKDSKTFLLTLNETCGLPLRVCKQWQRKSFINLPEELAYLRNPKTKASAEAAAQVLIEYLKNGENSGHIVSSRLTIGEWLIKFICLDGNPRSARNIARNRPYSVRTIQGYAGLYDTHIKEDPIIWIKMNEISESDILQFISRLAEKKLKNGSKMNCTRTFEMLMKFVRMTFNEYKKTHRGWINPFAGIDPPQRAELKERGTLTEEEIISLFHPSVLKDTMEISVCCVMFLAGLRRAEIFALTPDCLDWSTPKITVRQAWQKFNNKDRVLGPTKGKKTRNVPFHPIVQESIKKLWKENGQHEFVFSYSDGSTPGPSWVTGRFKKWMFRAGINIEGRNLVPHGARHSLASLLVERGASIKSVQDLLGHSDYKTTAIYLHTTDAVIKDIGNKIDFV